MYQSIPAINTPQATSKDLHILSGQPLRVLSTKLCLGGGTGFRQGQIFPEMIENLLNTFIFMGCFEEANQNRRKESFLFTQIAFVS